jgi:hypothetical protein
MAGVILHGCVIDHRRNQRAIPSSAETGQGSRLPKQSTQLNGANLRPVWDVWPGGVSGISEAKRK